MAATIVALRHTSPGGGNPFISDRNAWITTRHAALVSELQRIGVHNAWQAASAIQAHWADETGWGRAEYGYNIGNIRASGSACSSAHLLQGSDDTTPRPYCDYPTLAAGVAATVALLRHPRYATAWSYLLATGDGPGYFDRLLRAGWHAWSQASLDAYRSELAHVERIVGPPPPATPWGLYGIVALTAAAGVYIVLKNSDR